MLQKVNRLQRELVDVEQSKKELKTQCSKLENQKNRLENVFKATMKGGNMDLVDEVQMLVRRIEFLEEQAENRTKTLYLENQEPLQREVDMLKQKL